MSNDIHLYGAPWDDEYLYDDPAEVYENWVDSYEDRTPITATLEIIEYDSLPLSHFLCRADLLIDRALEILADDEITEGAWERVDKKYQAILRDPDVLDAFNNAREVLGMALDREVSYRMGGKKIATHWITFTEDGQPLYDGEPLYRPRLVLERRDEANRTVDIGGLMLSPIVGDDYWAYRVRLTDSQAVVGFPKYSGFGVGFASEEDENTNLPYRVAATEILDHIRNNKGDDAITDTEVITAIRLIQTAISADTGIWSCDDLADAPADYELTDEDRRIIPLFGARNPNLRARLAERWPGIFEEPR